MKDTSYPQAYPRVAADLLLGCRIETISWSPRAFVYHNFLTQEECDHLVKIGQQRVRAHVDRTAAEYCRASLYCPVHHLWGAGTQGAPETFKRVT